MTTSPATAPASMPIGLPIRPPRLMLAALLVGLGDWLLYGHGIGISFALFLGAVAAAAIVANGASAGRGRLLLAFGFLALGLLPVLEDVGFLSVAFALAGLALFAALIASGASDRAAAILRAARGLLLSGPARLVVDLQATVQDKGDSWRRHLRADPVLRWVVPIFVCAVFGLLFIAANPLIAGWLDSLSRSIEPPEFGIVRLLLWTILLAAAWPFIAIRLRAASNTPAKPAVPIVAQAVPSGLDALLDATAIRRCLVLVNLLFALQTGLDVTYLWAGVALPDGMTYAQYAHRGAYPLMLTVLLAAAVVIAAMRPDGPGRHSALIRGLVYLWIGQNLLLVGSSILRLDLYVAAYMLTLSRLAAFVWMGLVAVGLVLILAQIMLRRSNRWLIGANALALVATLYLWSLVNVPAVIADYNVAHSREITGTGSSFDIFYAMRLGPQAIPAIDRFSTAIPQTPAQSYLDLWRGEAVTRIRSASLMSDWRGWTFRDHRLRRYLSAHPYPPAPSTPMSNLPNAN